MPTKLKSTKVKKLRDRQPPSAMEVYFDQISRVSLLIIIIRVFTVLVAGFIFRGFWTIILYKNFIPIIAFTEKIEKFTIINTFSILFMNLVILLIYIKILLQDLENKTVKLTAWYFGIVMGVVTHTLNIYFSNQSDSFSINEGIGKSLIGILTLTSISFAFYLIKATSPTKTKPKSNIS